MRRVLILLILILVPDSRCGAQCPEQWFPGGWQIGRTAIVDAAVAWDPDGSGPSPEVLVVGGDFHLAGGSPVSNLAVWDGQSWSDLGGGFQEQVNSLALLNGELYASHSAGAQSIITRWDGQLWQPLPGPGGPILGVRQGELIAQLSSPLGTAAWNGSTWRSLNSPCSASAIGTYNGNLVTAHFGSYTPCVSLWDGATWTSLTNGITGAPQFGRASAIVEGPGGLHMAGTFWLGGSNGVARWDGTSWQPMGLGGWAASLHFFQGQLFAAGLLAQGFGLAAPVARWNGAQWDPLLTPGSYADSPLVIVLCTFRGNLIAAGQFTNLDGIPAASISRWDGAAWHPLGQGVDLASGGNVLALVAEGSDQYVGGYFQTAAGRRCGSVARWNGVAWDDLGGGVGGMNGAAVYAMSRFGGQLVVGGQFASAGGTPAKNIAAWDGSQWHAFGNGLGIDPFNSGVWALATFRGDLYAGGRGFTSQGGLARWDGAVWHTVPTPALGDVNALAVFNDELYVAGSIGSVPGGGIGLARWNGSEWLPVGLPGQYIYGDALAVYDGELIVGTTTLTFPQGIIRWNGQSWGYLGSGLGNPRVRALAVSGAELLVAGSFTSAGGVPANNVAIWNGSQWRSLGAGVQPLASNPEVRSAAPYASGFVVGGDFYFAGGQLSPLLAAWRRGVPACHPNCDCSSVTPMLNVSDFTCFLNRFAAADPYANCDQSTTAPTLNISDFICFMNKYAAGCP